MLQKNWSELIKPTKMEVNVEESNGRIGKLTAEPLERGFGLTLGNSIRRILLSSLQGAAITSIKIKLFFMMTQMYHLLNIEIIIYHHQIQTLHQILLIIGILEFPLHQLFMTV